MRTSTTSAPSLISSAGLGIAPPPNSCLNMFTQTTVWWWGIPCVGNKGYTRMNGLCFYNLFNYYQRNHGDL